MFVLIPHIHSSLSCFGLFRSLLDILGSSCVEKLEQIIPKVKKVFSIFVNLFLLIWLMNRS